MLPYVLALILAAHGWHTDKLSPDGALAALLVGAMTAAGGWWHVACLMGVYLLGSRLTRVCIFTMYLLHADDRWMA